MKAARIFDLAGEVALVTGASSGLGERFAEVLAANGARVVLAARRTDRLEAIAGRIRAAGGQAHVAALDVAERDAIPGAFDEAEAAFGTVTLLVNNAGISGSRPLLKMTDADWRSVMQVNLDAPYYMSMAAARRLIAAGKPGAIVNIASVLAFMAASTLTAYAASKGGVVQLTRNLAIELARHDIRVNAIAPGYVLTDINRAFFESPQSAGVIERIPQRRIGDPEDLDGTLLLLASRRASGFMTGSTVVVDGGHMLGAD